ncbi:MAG: carboxymuconolactone decarboxylase family protein [Armatimonadetes bacterium]|nr:carboxymuconolactone decarboxylase family protein [Armatimonadota bacterium]
MTRHEVYRDMEETIGLVPSFFKIVPDATLEQDWQAFKNIQLAEGIVPSKYKELVGLGISAVSKCRYCTLYHTEVARMHGATDDEIHEVLRYAANTSLWSAWVNGNQIDYEEFKDEVRRVGEFLMAKAQKEEVGKVAI